MGQDEHALVFRLASILYCALVNHEIPLFAKALHLLLQVIPNRLVEQIQKGGGLLVLERVGRRLLRLLRKPPEVVGDDLTGLIRLLPAPLLRRDKGHLASAVPQSSPKP